jgi:hypothetical protein
MPSLNVKQWDPVGLGGTDAWLGENGAVVRNLERYKQVLSLVGIANALFAMWQGAAPFSPSDEQTEEEIRETFEGPPGWGSGATLPLTGSEADNFQAQLSLAQVVRGGSGLPILTGQENPYVYTDPSSTDPVWPGPAQGVGPVSKVRRYGGPVPVTYDPFFKNWLP